MNWFEVRLKVSELLKDTVTNRLFELEAEGIIEEGSTTVRAFFKEPLRSQVTDLLPAYLHAISASAFPIHFELHPVREENWSESHKKFFNAQKLSQRFFIKPAWEKETPTPPGMIPILMEPGQAFGTGLHASTRLCIHAFENTLRWYPSPAEIQFLDVGTGTGILAVAAFKIGVRKIEAIDVDPLAVDAAEKTFQLNDCPGIRLSGAPISQVSGNFDILIANILLETHRELAEHYKRLLSSKSQLILSGILTTQLQEIGDIFDGRGFIFEFSHVFQEWAAVCFSRN